MATKAKAAKATTPAAATPAPAPMFAQLVQAPATPAATPKAPLVHVLALASGPVQCANHCAVLKGAKPLSALLASTSYTLGTKAYSPKAGTLNAVQWSAVQSALQSGPANGAAIASAFVAAGLQAGHAAQFVPYAAKAGWLALA